jgi:hypothetical protein
MSEPLTFVRLVGEFWGILGLRTSIRARDALDSLENEAYSFEKFALDTLGVFNDSLGIWLTLSNSPNKTNPMPTVALTDTVGTDTATGKINVTVPPGTTLVPTALLRAGAPQVPKAKVTVSLAGSVLTVSLSGLNTIPVSPGTYEGLVLGNGTPVARIQLQVS